MENNVNHKNLKNLNKWKRTFGQCLKHSKTNTSCEQTRFNIENSNASYVYSFKTYSTNEETKEVSPTPIAPPTPVALLTLVAPPTSPSASWGEIIVFSCYLNSFGIRRTLKTIIHASLLLRSDEGCGKLKNNSLNVSTILS